MPSGGRQWMNICTLTDDQGHTYNIYASTGSPPAFTPQHTGDLAITAGALWRWDGAIWQNVTSTASFPAGVIVVAKSGGQHTTIAAGLAVAVSGDTVLVYPGTYAESVTVPSGVRLIGFPAAQSVVISGSNTTSTRVTLPDSATLREITVVAPSSGANPAIDVSGLGVGELVVLQTVALVGAGGAGPGVRGAGSGTLAILQGLYHNGGAFSGAFLEVTAGSVVAREMVGNVGSCADFIRITGGVVRAQSTLLLNAATYACTDFLEISGGIFRAVDILLPEVTPSAVNAVHIAGDGVELDILAAHLHSQVYDILVDTGLTGAGTTINLNGVDFESARTSWPTGWDPDSIVAIHANSGVQGDNPGLEIIGDTSAGTIQFPASMAVGTGDHTVRGMVAYTLDASGPTWTNVTADLSVNSGSVVAWGTAADDGLYIAFPTKPTAYNLESVGALVAGAGALVVEIWTGAAWVAPRFMIAESGGSWTQYAQRIFQRPNADENLRLDIDGATWSAWATNDPPGTGTNRYWVRIRNAGAITTSPTVDRVRCGQDWVELKAQGAEMFGEAEVPRRVQVHQRLSDDLSGASPADGTIALSANVSLTLIDNEFDATQLDGFGGIISIDPGLDTSRVLTVKVRWFVVGVATGDVELQLITVPFALGDNVNAAALPETTSAVVTTIAAPSDGVLKETTFTFAVPTLTPGDNVGYALRRDARGSNPNDTLAGNIRVTSISCEGIYFR